MNMLLEKVDEKNYGKYLYEMQLENIKGFSNQIIIEYNVKTKSISENLKIDDAIVLKRDGKIGELRIGQNVTTDEQLDGETLFLRTASFNTGRFPQEPISRKLMDFLQNSYVIDGYNLGETYGKTITKYAEEFGVEKINKYLEKFKYDFMVEYGSESEGAGLRISIGSDKKAVFFKEKVFQFLIVWLMNLREIKCSLICYQI